MKKLFFLGLTMIMFLPTYAYELTQADTILEDTLNYYTHISNMHMGHVHIRDKKIDDKDVYLYTNSVLAGSIFSPKQLDTIRDVVGNMVVGLKHGKVFIYSDSVELGDLITTRFIPRAKKLCHNPKITTPPLITNTSSPLTASKGLANKHLAICGSHGMYYNQPLQIWRWQRVRLWTTVEDLYTSSYVNNFLVPMLRNAGAVVMEPRETDTQLDEIIVDENEATQSGTTFITQNGLGWGLKVGEVLYEGENPFTMGHYAQAQCVKGSKATLRYTPEVHQEGAYNVYISYKSLPNSTDMAHYNVVHNGIKTSFRINQTMGSSTWICLGNFTFGIDPTKNYVEVSADGNPKKVVTSDAIRFGGGYGNIARYPNPVPLPTIAQRFSYNLDELDTATIDSSWFYEQLEYNKSELAETSDAPRYAEAARYWMQYAGIPDSVYNYTHSANDYVDDYTSRGRWVNYITGGSACIPDSVGLKIPVNLCLSFHSDAGKTYLNDSMVGTLTIYTDFDNDQHLDYPCGGSRQCNRDLADFVMYQIVHDMRSTYCPEWPQRMVWNSSYAESRHPKIPSVLLELLSHQNFPDMVYGLDPRTKFLVSRAIYKSIVRFLHSQDQSKYVIQPLPIQDFEIKRNGDGITLRWSQQKDSLEPTATPTYYVLYTRSDNRDWDNGKLLTTNSYTFTPKKGMHYDFKVVAGNEGGISMSSEILSAYLAPNDIEKGTALIINAFTRVCGPQMAGVDSVVRGIIPYSQGVPYGRETSYIGDMFEYDQYLPWTNDDEGGFGTSFYDKAFETNVGNTFDYPAMHGRTLEKLGYSYVSTSVGALKGIDSTYCLVDVINGKQKTTRIGLQKEQIDFKVFPENLRTALTDYTQRTNARLLVAGSYIASDMREPSDTTFTKQVLHYAYQSYMASTKGLINIKHVLPKATYTYYKEPNPTMIQCESPDAIEPTYGAKYVARYADSHLCAGIAYNDDNQRLIVLPFNLESVKEFDALYGECIQWLMQ